MCNYVLINPKNTSNDHGYIVINISFFLILSGMALRFIYLDKNFWLDEFLSVKESLSIDSLNRLNAISLNPYFLFLSLITKIFGINVVIFRLFSVFWNISTIITTYYVGKNILNKLSGTLGALFFTFFPLSVILSQEIRMYSMLSLFSLIQLYFFIFIITNLIKSIEISSKKYLAYFVLTLLMLFIHFSATILLASELLLLIILIALNKIAKRYIFRVLSLSLLPLGLFILWFQKIIISKLLFFSSNDNFIKVYVKTGHLGEDLSNLLLNISLGTILHRNYNFLMSFIILLIFIFTLVNNFRNKRSLQCLFLSIVIIFYVSMSLAIGTYTPRHYFIIVPIIAIIFGNFFSNIFTTRRSLFYLLIMLFFSLSTHSSIDRLIFDKNISGRKWDELARSVPKSEDKRKSAILISMPQLNDLFRYYYHGNLPVIGLDAKSDLINNSLIRDNEIGLPFVNQKLASSIAKKVSGYQNIYFIIDGSLKLSDPDNLIQDNLSKYFSISDFHCFPPDKYELCYIHYVNLSI
jgi:hypothetical protein